MLWVIFNRGGRLFHPGRLFGSREYVCCRMNIGLCVLAFVLACVYVCWRVFVLACVLACVLTCVSVGVCMNSRGCWRMCIGVRVCWRVCRLVYMLV